MTTLYLIRHAEAEGNLYRRIHGNYDSLVTDNGYRQIRALKERFAHIPVDAVYSSDLFRTMTTAIAVYRPKYLELHTRADLRELHMGDWEDRSWAGVSQREPEEMALFSAGSPLFRAPNGERYQDIRERGMKAVREIAAQHPDQTVAVFSHGTIIRHTVAGFLGREPNELEHSDNTAVTCLEMEGDQVRPVFLSDNSHLSPEISTLAQQHWWKNDSRRVDINLWYDRFDPRKKEDRDFYMDCRAEAWSNLYGSLDRYDGPGFFQDARNAWRRDPESLSVVMWHNIRVGILQLEPDREAEQGHGYISFLYLTPEQRGSGVGIQLIGKAVSVFRPRGRNTLALTCSDANKHALAFYEKYGFRKVGTSPGAFGILHQMEKYIGYRVQEDLL